MVPSPYALCAIDLLSAAIYLKGFVESRIILVALSLVDVPSYCHLRRPLAAPHSVLVQALFLWIVRLINTSLGKGDESLPFIGVLDIFGETFYSIIEPSNGSRHQVPPNVGSKLCVQT